jgi:hypothetical protein
MSKKNLLAFLWWFSTPIFITLFFILILIYSQSFDFIGNSIILILLLVLLPLLWDFILKTFYKIDFSNRQKILALIYTLSFAYILIKYHNFFSKFTLYCLLIFSIFLIISYLLFFLKQNQYTFLLGGMLALSSIISINKTIDFQTIIILQLFLSAVISYYFIDENIDKLSGIILAYIGGIIFVSLEAIIFNFIL